MTDPKLEDYTSINSLDVKTEVTTSGNIGIEFVIDPALNKDDFAVITVTDKYQIVDIHIANIFDRNEIIEKLRNKDIIIDPIILGIDTEVHIPFIEQIKVSGLNEKGETISEELSMAMFNWELGLPYWYIKFVYKYFKWML